MILVFAISIAVTVFLLLATLFTLVAGDDPTEARLAEVAAATPETATTSVVNTAPTTGLGRMAAHITPLLNPIRGIRQGGPENARVGQAFRRLASGRFDDAERRDY